MYKKIACVFISMMIIAMSLAACGTPEVQDTGEPTQPSSAQDSVSEAQSPPKTTPQGEESDGPYQGELTTILLMGSMDGDFSDENNQNYALTHILVTIDPKTRSLRFTTFPYNLKIKPVLEGEEDAEYTQLQFLYSQYGADAVVTTLSKKFNVQIDGWVVMNMHAVKAIVDELGGLEIDVRDLSVNEMSETVEMILGYVWEEIKEEGKQFLGGIQIIGYFMDTYRDLDEGNPAEDEEKRFRTKHTAIINSLISAVKTLGLTDGQLVEIAKNIKDDFVTDIKERTWDDIAKMALACTENKPEYLYVPQKIVVEEGDYMRSLVYEKTADVRAVLEFVRGE